MDALLVKRAQRGDAEAFVSLIEKHKTALYKAAKSYLISEEDIADVMQDTVLAAYEHMGELKNVSYFKTWLTRILINQCKDFLRRQKHYVISEEVVETASEMPGNDREFYELIKELPEDSRMIFYCTMEKDLRRMRLHRFWISLAGDEDTNLTKGAMFTDEADFYFCVNCGEDIFAGENIYVDMERSTEDMLYCSEYILWSESLKEGAVPQISIEEYPCTRGELFAMSEEEYQEASAKIRRETIELADKGQIPVTSIDLGENGYLEYSPMAISIDMSKGMGLSEEEAQDPYYLEHLEIKYKDGSSYIISDKEQNIENSGYVVGADVWYKTAFNRLVDTNEISEIIVNDRSFPVE